MENTKTFGIIGKDSRIKSQENNNPAPGTYFQEEGTYTNLLMSWGKGIKFGKDEKGKVSRTDSPGPGLYEIKGITDINKEKGKGTSMYFKYKDK